MKDSVAKQLDKIRSELSELKLDDSLLFLNHLLGISRGVTSDPILGPIVAQASPPVLPYVVHFLAKHLLQVASNLGARTLDWNQFRRLTAACIALDDPIEHDENWKHADPTGFFERIMFQQLTPQRRLHNQRIGLALGLFRDVGVIEWPFKYDLRADIESAIGTSVEKFVSMGFLTLALRSANHKGNPCNGTFTHMHLAEAYGQGIPFAVPEVWQPFLDRVACERDFFRSFSEKEEFRPVDDLVDQFSFNPLWRFPITNLGEGRYLAVDPELVLARATLGLFFDVFERDRTRFSDRFGHAFDRFVGQLLQSTVSPERLWSSAIWEQTSGRDLRKPSKLVDWIYQGAEFSVLFECKSLRPSLTLTSTGSESSVSDLRFRIADAVEQLSQHGEAIAAGKWDGFGLRRQPLVGVIVTYGKLQTANGPFMQRRVGDLLDAKRVSPIPYVVLSIEEMDSCMRLVECGHSLDQLMHSMATAEKTFDPLHAFHDELRVSAISSFALEKAESFLNGLTPGRVYRPRGLTVTNLLPK